MSENTPKFGEGTATFDSAGGLSGIKALVDDFYRIMQTLPDAQHIRKMHPADINTSADKLYSFLSGWMGGPGLYQEKYGSISIPGAHMHLDIDEDDRDMWMLCMQKALDAQPYSNELKNYLYQQFMYPAELIRQVCSNNSQSKH